MILTLIVADEAPLIVAEIAPNYRSVHIELTKEQIEKIGLRVTGSTGGRDIRERITQCFVE